MIGDNHNVVNQLSKSVELLIGVIRSGNKQDATLVEVLDVQQATINELRRELQCVKNELGSKVNKDTMQAVFSGTNTLMNADGTVNKTF